MVIAVREDSKGGPFIDFQVDNEIVECSECTEGAAYRLRYTSDQRGNIAEHRFKAYRLIVDEHPNHSVDTCIPSLALQIRSQYLAGLSQADRDCDHCIG
jgi:hypothetical protein